MTRPNSVPENVNIVPAKTMECCNINWRVPRPSKACCCIPLRRGIIAFVYLNLAIALTAHSAFIFFDHIKWFIMLFTKNQQEMYLKLARTKGSYLICTLIILAGALAELGMTFVALVGLHRKDLKVIRAYFFYTVFYTIILGVTRVLNFHVVLWKYELPATIIYLSFKFYYIVMLRSQVKKMETTEKEEVREVELNKVQDIESTESETVNENNHLGNTNQDTHNIADETIGLIVENDGEEYT